MSTAKNLQKSSLAEAISPAEPAELIRIDADSLDSRRSLRRSDKAPEAFRTISEVAAEIGVEAHVLRFWETKFPSVKPIKRAGGRRYYRPEDIEVLKKIKKLLRHDNFRIKGAQKQLKIHGGALSQSEDSPDGLNASEATGSNDQQNQSESSADEMLIQKSERFLS